MQHLKTGPYSETPTLVEQRKKRIEKRKRKLEETKATARQLRARGPRTISLGKRNTYFLIGVAVLLVAICVIAILLHFGVL